MLVNRNITVGSLRTSVRLEPEFWTALTEISAREKLDIDQLCTMIDGHLGELGRTAGIRVFIASYYAADKDARREARIEREIGARNSFTQSPRPYAAATGRAFA